MNRVFLSLLLQIFSFCAEAEDFTKTTQEIASEILSPYCPGKLLKDCPTIAAEELKNDIDKQIVSGKSKEDVIAQLLEKFGDKLDARVQTNGFGIFAWLVPLIIFFIGDIIIIRYILKMTKKGRNE